MRKLSDFMRFTDQALNQFGKDVVKQSQKRLLRKSMFQSNKPSKGNLYNSIKYEVETMENSISVKFPFMKDVDYAKYIDQGVTGKDPFDLPKGALWYGKQRNKNTKSPFKYGSGTGKGYIKSGINKYLVKKGIRGVGEKRKGLIYVISRSVYLSGIPAKFFFTKSFDNAFKKLPPKLVQAFALDIKDKFKEFTTS